MYVRNKNYQFSVSFSVIKYFLLKRKSYLKKLMLPYKIIIFYLNN